MNSREVNIDTSGKQVFAHSPFPLINAVIDGQQAGNLFALGQPEKEIKFIYHKAAFSYIIASAEKDVGSFLEFVSVNQTLPEYFHIYDAPSHVIESCYSQDASFNCKTRTRIQLKYLEPVIQQPDRKGFSCFRIDADNISSLSVFGVELGSKFWSSEEDFLLHGFGFFIATETGQPVSICYAACVAARTAEIDVATVPDFRQQGLAKIAVAAFVEHCITNNITANWDCFEENTGSLKTALSLGFTKIKTYPFLSIFNKKKQHEIN